MDGIRKYVGADNVRQTEAGTVVHFEYRQNPEGLKTGDGYCLCPIFEDAPKGVSSTCGPCSNRGTGRVTRVELTDSVLRGGKKCSFTVTVTPASA